MRRHLVRNLDQPFLLGLFLPGLDGGWSITTASRGTNYSFPYNRECLRLAEAMGFDFSFQVGQWRPGYGGQIRYREKTLEPLTSTAAFAPVTERIMLISTVHILYGVHPILVAKQGANIDHISNGRWGINIVAGFDELERKMFGMAPIDHPLRYAMADEFVTLMKRAWTEEKPFDFEGRFYRSEGAFVAPKPVQQPHPLIVNAGMSPAGQDFAARHAAAMFVTNPVEGGPNPRDYPELKTLLGNARETARRYGRELKFIINPHIICRPTEEAAWRHFRWIVDHADMEAVHNLTGHTSENPSWPKWSLEHVVAGGNILLVGSPEQIIDGLLRFRAVGCDGVQLTFFDYHPDLEQFGRDILPLMRQAGLRR
jgi:FMNH2-dependent dimethyl sulfone monooxygenase